MSSRHDYAYGSADTTTRTDTDHSVTSDMVYMGIVRIKDKSSRHSLWVSAAQLEHVVNRFKAACPEEVRGSVTLMVCFGEGMGRLDEQNGTAAGHLAINAYRSRTKAEIAEDALAAQGKAASLNRTADNIDRAEYERLKAKFEALDAA